MTIALFSPINPVSSGISDYTEEMLDALSQHFKFDLFHDKRIKPKNRDLSDRFNFIPFDEKTFDASPYEQIVYHMGNYYEAHHYIYNALKKYPGIIVLHDYILQGFYAERFEATGNYEEYVKLEQDYYGHKGEEISLQIKNRIPPPIWDTVRGLDFPLNEEIIHHAKALIVHSDFVKEKIQDKYDKPIVKIPHHGHKRKEFDTLRIRKHLGVGEDDLLVISAGFINKNKRFETIFKAMAELDYPRLKYVIAGEDRGSLIQGLLVEHSIEVIRKDHLPLKELEGLICASDICINLRYPTMGESSGSLLRMMGYGKPTLVTNFGSYREFPDHCVLKVNPDIDEKQTLLRYLRALIEDKDFRLSIGREAKKHIDRECSIEKCVAEYAHFIKEQS
jgi:glycosyltransferase involved in cell wall biosynthesis